ncbi:methyltransferase domain-containing protein [Streptomyces boncukensis]|uniref:Protein-L-isoaspartate O-methyltransferase n=1 Tax=Streptomyces boncukensis TaxID=2711219 RepID=A0A6G4WXJ1_9ACTN|nr:methyltransferase domain-containing protein [Streptomyces boncukensis]
MATTADDPVAHAAEDLPAEAFHGDDGRAVRPCTPPEVTARHLRMLDLAPGHRVLDIGLGSGYSAALAARLTAPGGQVTAVDINPELAQRARTLYDQHGLNVRVQVGDGMLGHPPAAPYDRILAGATPPHIPDAWLEQLAPGGILVCGVRLGPLPGSYAIARITADDHGGPGTVQAHPGGYTPMTAAASHTVPAFGSGNATVSTLATAASEDHQALVDALTDRPHSEPSGLDATEYLDFKNWLLAVRPEELLEAATPLGNGVGVGDTSGVPATASFAAGELLVADSADSTALDTMRQLISRWRQEGAPSTGQLRATLKRHDNVWHLHVDV